MSFIWLIVMLAAVFILIVAAFCWLAWHAIDVDWPKE